MCGNPDAFCKIYLEVVEIVTKTWNVGKFYQNIWKCGLKRSKFSGMPVLETTKKVWNSDLHEGALFYLEEPIFVQRVIRNFRFWLLCIDLVTMS